ncbi:hypothetical protein KM043_011399 [Ampulex compressa]|nr:hypothetical protein KM043_011399 [Ampulex compressa]
MKKLRFNLENFSLRFATLITPAVLVAAEFEVRLLFGYAASIDNDGVQPRSGNSAAAGSAGVEFQAPEGQKGSDLSLLHKGHEGSSAAQRITVSPTAMSQNLWTVLGLAAWFKHRTERKTVVPLRLPFQVRY